MTRRGEGGGAGRREVCMVAQGMADIMKCYTAGGTPVLGTLTYIRTLVSHNKTLRCRHNHIQMESSICSTQCATV